jgi:hypothetical protein
LLKTTFSQGPEERFSPKVIRVIRRINHTSPEFNTSRIYTWRESCWGSFYIYPFISIAVGDDLLLLPPPLPLTVISVRRSFDFDSRRINFSSNTDATVGTYFHL